MKNIEITKDLNKSKNIVLFITSSIILLLGLSFFFESSIKFIDANSIFYVIMLLYFGCEFTNYLLTRNKTGMNSLYISLACIIASVSGLKYSSDPSNMVIGITLIGWIILMIIIKLIKIEDLRNKYNTGVFVNIFTMSLFILLGFLVVTNIIKGISNVPLMLGFFFTANGIINFIENISVIKFEK